MGKRPQPRLRIDALTGEWRNGEAGEGRGSELCEPGGLRHQAGGASWRDPPLGPGWEDITWPDQVAPRGRKASSTRKIKPQASNLLSPACIRSSNSEPVDVCSAFPLSLLRDGPGDDTGMAVLPSSDCGNHHTAQELGLDPVGAVSVVCCSASSAAVDLRQGDAGIPPRDVGEAGHHTPSIEG